MFRWHVGSGGEARWPHGMAAVVLASCLLVPLLGVPLASEHVIGVTFLPASHLTAGLVVLATGALGHLVMYGITTHSRGVSRHIVIPGQPRSMAGPPLRAHLDCDWFSPSPCHPDC